MGYKFEGEYEYFCTWKVEKRQSEQTFAGWGLYISFFILQQIPPLQQREKELDQIFVVF